MSAGIRNRDLLKLILVGYLLIPCSGFSQRFPVSHNFFEFVPDHIDDHFGEVDSLLFVNNIHKVTTFYRAKETDSLRLLRIRYFEKGRRTKDERYELSTGKLERLIQYSHSPGKLEVEMIHYPSVENGYRLPARHFRYLLNADYVHPYRPDSLGRIKMSLRYTWQGNGDILYETFDFKGNSIVKETMKLKPDAQQRLQRPNPTYPRITRREIDSDRFEEFHFNKWGNIFLHRICDLANSYGFFSYEEHDNNGLLIRERRVDEYRDSRKLTLEYVYVNE